MSNTAIATLTAKGKQAELTPLEQAILAEIESEQNAFDYMPTRIKFPSGDTLVFGTNDGDVIKPPFRAIVAVSQKARAFWPDSDTAGLPPLCASPDGVQGHFNIDDHEQAKVAVTMPKEFRHPALSMLSGAAGPHACHSCPLALWGSGNGRGQSCKAMRRLIVLVEGWTMPAILTLPPTSVKVWDVYASKRSQMRGQAYFTCWTEFGLDTAVSKTSGKKYGTLRVSPGDRLTDEHTNAVMEIRNQYASLVRELGITADDYDTTESNGHTVDGHTVIDGRKVDASTGEILDEHATRLFGDDEAESIPF